MDVVKHADEVAEVEGDPPAAPDLRGRADAPADPEARRRVLAESLRLSGYPTGGAEEAWALITRLFFSEGKPRFPAIAAEFELSPPQAAVIRLLVEPRTMSDLAYAMACDNSNVTGIVDRLSERGLVERRTAEHDRRVKLIAATPAGERLRAKLNRRLAEPPEPLKRLSKDDQRRLAGLLRRAVGE